MEQAKKKFYKKGWFWVLVVIVLFIIIGASGDSSPRKVGTDTGSSQSNQPEVFKVGDQIKQGDTLLTVTKVTKNWKSSNQFDKPSNPDDVFVVVTVAIENTGSQDLSLAGLWDFKLEDANGIQKDQSFSGIGLKKLPTGSLSPNGKASGDLIFEADRNALNNLKLHYEPMFSFGQPVIIELQ